MAPGKARHPESPGFRRGLFVTEEAPGGNPGTPGMKTIPLSMPHGGTRAEDRQAKIARCDVLPTHGDRRGYPSRPAASSGWRLVVFSSLTSVSVASVRRSVPATLTAFSNAIRTTFVGSTMPAAMRSP